MIDQASLVIGECNWAVKEGSLLGYKLIDGKYYPRDMDVVRATTGTRVNSAGLVELVPYNLIGYSQDFSNAYWFGEPGNTITSNTTTAPDGTLTADTFTATASNVMNVHNFAGFNIPNGTFTYSIYLKNNGTNLIEAYLFKVGTGFAARGEINFSAGTFTASVGTGNIENVGNGWYRVSLTNTYTDGTYTTGTFTTSTTGTRSVFAWGAQLVEGSTAKDYQKTETRLNIPRLDYSNGTCPSLLVEPQRTNLFNFSEQLDNAYWSKIGSITITPNNSVSPSGIQNADLATKSGGSARIQRAFTGLTAGTRTLSCFVKAGTGTIFFINAFDGIVDKGAEFNVSTGVVGFVSAGVTATIEDYGNGWYRLSHTYTSAGTSYSCQFYLDSVGTFEVWGFQFEDLSSYPTSYIPTTSASVTRNADVISKTGISSLIGQTEGVIFIDAYRTQKSVNYQALIGLGNGTSSSQMMEFFYNSSNELTVGVYNSGQQFVNNTVIANGRHKIALAYKANDFALYIDGVLIASDTSGTVPTMSQLNIGEFNYTSGYAYADGINAVALWKTRLTNSQLAQLTTI